jgi:hypothetical protein
MWWMWPSVQVEVQEDHVEKIEVMGEEMMCL